MSTFLREVIDNARERRTGLVTGPPAQPSRRTWRSVHHEAASLAGALEALGVGRGDRVVVLAGDPGQVAPLVQGIWLRGASVTMLHQPTPRTDLQQWIDDTLGTCAMLGARLAVAGTPFEPLVEIMTGHRVRAVTYAELLHGGCHVEPVPTDDDDVLLLQLTSGSTGSPKAISITHGNASAHCKALAEAAGIDPSTDVGVSWLPLYHDMGMVGFFCVPMQLGIEVVCVTPGDFLESPLIWPDLITRYGGTMTAAPNFAYSLVARHLDQSADGRFDLSSLRWTLTGAEPVDPAATARFVEAGARFGLRAESIVPAYGMAEATLAISIAMGGLVVDSVDPTILDRDARAETSASAAARHLPKLGPPLPGLDVRVVDEQRNSLPPRRVGEVQLRGDSLSRHQITAERTVDLLDAHGWLSTGDLGYLTEEGEIIVCGRKKDIIIVGGRNLSPTDIERVAGNVPGVRPGSATATRMASAGTDEEFAIAVESKHHADLVEAERIRAEIANGVLAAFGVSPRVVLLFAPGSLPKTPSGKVRRSETVLLVEAAMARANDPQPVAVARASPRD